MRSAVNLSNIPANQVVRYLLARFPGAAKRVEQARAILAYAMARATGEKVWLDKARALGDSLTRMGVNRFDDRYHTWLNCTLKTKTVLDQLAALHLTAVAGI